MLHASNQIISISRKLIREYKEKEKNNNNATSMA